MRVPKHIDGERRPRSLNTLAVMKAGDDEEVHPSVRAAEAVAEAEMAAAEQAKALAAAQALAVRAARAQAEAERAAREAAEAEEAALEELDSEFPTVSVSEHHRLMQERAEKARAKERLQASNASRAGPFSVEPSNEPLFGPVSSSMLGHRAIQQEMNRQQPTEPALGRADAATEWRRRDPEPETPKLFVPAPKPEKSAWGDVPDAPFPEPMPTRAPPSPSAHPPPAWATRALEKQKQQQLAASGGRSAPPRAWSSHANGGGGSFAMIQAQEEGSKEARKKLEQLTAMGWVSRSRAHTVPRCCPSAVPYRAVPR